MFIYDFEKLFIKVYYNVLVKWVGKRVYVEVYVRNVVISRYVIFYFDFGRNV